MSEARTGHTTESAASGDCHLVLIVAAVHAAEGGGAELAGLGVHPHHGDTDQTSVLTLAPHNCRGALGAGLSPQQAQNIRVLCHTTVTFLLQTLHWLPTVCCGWTEAHLCWIMIIIGNL